MFKKAFRRVAVALGLMSPALAMAEGASTGIDLSAATSFMTDAQTKITAWVTTNSGVIVAILGAVMALVFIFIGYRWVTRGAKKA